MPNDIVPAAATGLPNASSVNSPSGQNDAAEGSQAAPEGGNEQPTGDETMNFHARRIDTQAYVAIAAEGQEPLRTVAQLRAMLSAMEPVAHDAKAYAEATRILIESEDADENTLIKVAYLAQDATEKLLDMVLTAFEP